MIKNSRFFNFNTERRSAALGTCSHCFHPAASSSGGHTFTTENLEFTNVPLRIHWQHPWREIIHDLDGSLTGMGPDSWAVASHNFGVSHITDKTEKIGFGLGDGATGMQPHLV